MINISKIAVVGAGSMGSGIVEVAAKAGCMVYVWDPNPAQEQLFKSIAKHLDKLAEKGKWDANRSQEVLNSIQWIDRLESIPPCDLIIEAIPEKLELKVNTFQTLEAHQPETTILASNTSSLSIAGIAGGLAKPERFLGLHFFNPAFIMPLVEVIPGIATEPNLAHQMCELMKAWGKIPVVAKDTPGFIVNRVARPFYGEAIRIFEEGIASPEEIDQAMKTLGGFKMGPFELMDFIGHDVNFAVTESVYAAFWNDPRYKPSFAQKRLVEAGRLGRKSGQGFYSYVDGQAQNQAVTENPQRDQRIFERILVMLMNEAIDARFWNIASAKDLDLAMTKGVNYPKGLLQWADEWGAQKVHDLMLGLYQRYNEDRYRPSPLIADTLHSQTNFYNEL